MKKKKFMVYAIIDASKFIGEFFAKNKAEAEEMADAMVDEILPVSICHHCSHEIDIGDFLRYEIDEVEYEKKKTT